MENDLLNVRACALCFSFYILILPSVSRLPSADYYCSLIKMFFFVLLDYCASKCNYICFSSPENVAI